MKSRLILGSSLLVLLVLAAAPPASQSQVHAVNPSISIDIGEQAINTFIMNNFQPEFSYGGGPLYDIPQTCLDNLGPFKPFANAVEIGEGQHRIHLKLQTLALDFERGAATITVAVKVDYGYDTATSSFSNTVTLACQRTLRVEDFTYDVGIKKIKVFLNNPITHYFSDSFMSVSVRGVALTMFVADVKMRGNASTVGIQVGDRLNFSGPVVEFSKGYVQSIQQYDTYFIATVNVGGGKCPFGAECPRWNGKAGPDNGPGILTKSTQTWVDYLEESYSHLPDYVLAQLKNKFSEVEIYSQDLLTQFVHGLPVDQFFRLSADIIEFLDYTAVKADGLVQAQIEVLRNYIQSGVYKYGLPSQILDPRAIQKIDELFQTAGDFTSQHFNEFLTYYRTYTSQFLNMEDDVKALLDQQLENVVAYKDEQKEKFRHWVETNGYADLPQRVVSYIRGHFVNPASDYTDERIAAFYRWLQAQEFPRLIESAAVFWDDRAMTIGFSFEDDFLRLSVAPHLETEEPLFQLLGRRGVAPGGREYLFEIQVVSNTKYRFKGLQIVQPNGSSWVQPIDGQLDGTADSRNSRYTKIVSFRTTLHYPTFVFYAKFWNEHQLISVSKSSNFLGATEQFQQFNGPLTIDY